MTSREIKFRAWSGEKMTYDWLTIDKYESEHIGTHFTPCSRNGFAAVVMQYTGLKDKNGIEIYEGDVVELEGVISRLDRRPSGKKRTIKLLDCTCQEAVRNTGTLRSEVLGNIYENPELVL